MAAPIASRPATRICGRTRARHLAAHHDFLGLDARSRRSAAAGSGRTACSAACRGSATGTSGRAPSPSGGASSRRSSPTPSSSAFRAPCSRWATKPATPGSSSCNSPRSTACSPIFATSPPATGRPLPDWRETRRNSEGVDLSIPPLPSYGWAFWPRSGQNARSRREKSSNDDCAISGVGVASTSRSRGPSSSGRRPWSAPSARRSWDCPASSGRAARV